MRDRGGGPAAAVTHAFTTRRTRRTSTHRNNNSAHHSPSIPTTTNTYTCATHTPYSERQQKLGTTHRCKVCAWPGQGCLCSQMTKQTHTQPKLLALARLLAHSLHTTNRPSSAKLVGVNTTVPKKKKKKKKSNNTNKEKKEFCPAAKRAF